MLESYRKDWAINIHRLLIVFNLILFIFQKIMMIIENNYITIYSGFNYTYFTKYIYPLIISIIISCININLLKKYSFNKKVDIYFSLLSSLVIASIHLISHNFMYYYNFYFVIISLFSLTYFDEKIVKQCISVSAILSIFFSFLYIKCIDLNSNVIINLFIIFILLLLLYFISFKIKTVKEYVYTLSDSCERYKEMATLDNLTKCFNHAYYKERVKSFINESDKVFLAVIDIDNFKKVNDTYGHKAGDSVLQFLGMLINRHNSKDCFVARYGGEEFVLLFKNKDHAKVIRLLENVRKNFGSHVFKELDYSKVTFSCGLAKLNKKDNEYTLFNRADENLYEAKHGSKNQIVFK